MTNRPIFDHGPVERREDHLGAIYQCGSCGYVGETVRDFDQQDCVEETD